MKNNVTHIQSPDCSKLEKHRLCSYDRETIDGPTKPLLHQAARFWLIREGRAKVRIQDKTYDLEPGCLVAILPLFITEVLEVEELLQYSIIVYQFDTVNLALKGIFNTMHEPADFIAHLTESPVVPCGSLLPRINHVFEDLHAEFGMESTVSVPENPPEMCDIYAVAKLVELIVLYRRLVSIGGQDASNDTASNKIEIFRYIYAHLSEKLTPHVLSKIFYMSESSISQYITQVTGLSFSDFLNEIRITQTMNFLLYTDFTLEELAEILGYVDASHISKVFSAQVGIRAGEYRKTYQKFTDICKVKETRLSYEIVSYLYRHYQDDLTVGSVAEHFGISVTELNKDLLYLTERNFDDYLNFVRINHACRLLKETNKAITDIAIEVGYNTTKTFTRNFLKQKHMTVGTFRRNIQLQENSLE